MIEFEKSCDILFLVNKGDDVIATLQKCKDGVWILDEMFDSFPKLTSQELRQIADKLDELNK